MNKYYSIDVDEQKYALLNSKIGKIVAQEFIDIADNCLGDTYDILTFSEFRLIDETGDRIIYETKYKKRRIDCTALAAALWLTGDEKYKKQLTDVIFAICDEFTWCVPAHLCIGKYHQDIDTIIGQIDLYNSRTANCLIEVIALVGDELYEYVRMRVEYEIRRRIIESLKKRTFAWENNDNNWSITCNCGVINSILTFGTEEEKKTFMPRFIPVVDVYLSGFGKDYCCVEGAGYWRAFTNFLYCADMILCYTKGEVNYFKRDDVKQIAMFPQRVMMNERLNVKFSDVSSKFGFYPGLHSYMKRVYGDMIYMPNFELRTIDNITMGEGLRELLWLDVNYEEGKLKPETSYFKYTQWYVKRDKNYSFAAKGGNNEESHNHNDIGSFMITKGDNIIIDELGAAPYTRQNFEDDERYKIINNSSLGHSIPIINGEGQINGAEFCAENTDAGENFFKTDIEGAYKKGIIKKIHREFVLGEDCIELSDTFLRSDVTKTITERLVTLKEPEVLQDCVKIGEAKIIYDAIKFKVKIQEQTFRTHHNTDEIAYFIDFDIPETENVLKLKIFI